MYRILDIETENTGTDIMRDNKRIISVQIGDSSKQELYYADSKDPLCNLSRVEKRITSLLSQGYIFAGYYIKGFDIPVLKQFMGIEIAESNTFDLSQTQRVAELKMINKRRLEEVCAECGIETHHKQRMNEKAEEYKARHDIKDQAHAKAEDLAKNRGWTLDFAYRYALDKIAGGTAIIDAYQEFVTSGGNKSTLFYEYAVGDVISEYNLLKVLGY